MNERPSIGLRVALTILTMTLFVTSTYAATEKVLHSFNDTDGATPQGGLIFDARGNLYGTTFNDGAHHSGAAFELTPKAGGGWTEQVLHSFGNGNDGEYPVAGLVLDTAGNLYGTTTQGGAYASGAVFELTPKVGGGWSESVLHSFGSGKDGIEPTASMIIDAAGNLYGTTVFGGTYGYGTVFELTPKAGGGWTEKVLHSFNANGKDGTHPYAGLIIDAASNLYGTTVYGGGHRLGTVFELTPKAGGGWTEKVLHRFSGRDGSLPFAGLAFDPAGNLYGTTEKGGSHGVGIVFELKPKAGGGWTEKVLHNFYHRDGGSPQASVIFDAVGNLYSTTYSGGAYGAYGTVFELAHEAGGGWTEKILHNFNYNGTDGINPFAGLIFDGSGDLYGTTGFGGAHSVGVVFEITP